MMKPIPLPSADGLVIGLRSEATMSQVSQISRRMGTIPMVTWQSWLHASTCGPAACDLSRRRSRDTGTWLTRDLVCLDSLTSSRVKTPPVGSTSGARTVCVVPAPCRMPEEMAVSRRLAYDSAALRHPRSRVSTRKLTMRTYFQDGTPASVRENTQSSPGAPVLAGGTPSVPCKERRSR
jgi:hypothetical protein